MNAATTTRPRPATLFGLVWGRHLVYNQCWEDPAVDHLALNLSPRDRVLMITSAGCNALDYALAGARVVAVDANPRQNHLLELKCAAIRALEFDEFFELFGRGGSPRAAHLLAHVRPGLSAAAAAFWDAHASAFEPERARGGSFYYSGSAGLCAYLLRRYLALAGAWPGLERVLAAGSIGEQIDLWRTHVRPRLLRPALVELLGTRGVLALLGVPVVQRRLVDAHAGGFARFLGACLERVMSVALLRDNYFWSVYLRGAYLPEACPAYLQPANFERLRGGLVDNIEIRTASVTEALAAEPECFDAFVLLDHLDWMAQSPALLSAEWHQIFAHAAPDARIIFRSGGPDAAFLPMDVLVRLAFDQARAAELHRRDRVATYGSFHIARLAHA